MKVLDLFAGLEGWSKPFRQAGHEVFTVDYDKRFPVDLHKDILTLRPKDIPWRPDLVLASPPCETFSVASIGTHWAGGNKAYVPKTSDAAMGITLVKATLSFIQAVKAQSYVIENPRGVLRNVGIMPHAPTTIWYCHYGETRAKPTDIWHNVYGLDLHPPCHNRRAGHNSDCCCADHEAAPRGARTGTQGLKSYATRSLIPAMLANQVRLVTERMYP